MMVIVIGRGHGGTRAISQTLSESGVFMGESLNGSYDLVPADAMYEACRIAGRYVEHQDGVSWDFTKLIADSPDPGFEPLVKTYLSSVLASEAPRRGWKLPETTLVLPWIIRLFPEAYYINWIRDPRDSILGGHLTDDLSDFNIDYEATEDEFERRAVSYRYQFELVENTPKPSHWVDVRFEDFVCNQEATLAALEHYLDFPLARIPVKPEAVGRWKQAQTKLDFPILDKPMRRYGYV